MRVLIVDDHDFLRRGIRAVLASSTAFEVCGEAANGHEALQKARELKPDVVTMDISMPGLNGLEATREILRTLPDTRVLILSQHDSFETMRQALHARASGYVAKSAISQELICALETVQQGGTYFPTELSANTSTSMDTAELLQLVSSTLSLAVTRCTRDLRYLWANQSYADWLCRPLRDIIGHSIEEVLGTEAFESLKPHFDRVLSGEKVAYEQKVRFQSLGPRWISATYTPTVNLLGAVDGWVAVVQDISSRKRTEQALLDSECQQRLLAAVAGLSLSLRDPGQLTHEACRQVARHFAVSRCGLSRVDLHAGTIITEADYSATLPSLSGEYSMSEYASQYADGTGRGRITVVNDARHDHRTAAVYERIFANRAICSYINVPLHREDLWVANFWIAHHLPRAWSEREVSFFVTIADRVWVALEDLRYSEALLRSEARLLASQAELEQKVQERTQELVKTRDDLRSLSARLLQAQDEERRRIARELHDGVGQSLTAIAMNISTVHKERAQLSTSAAQCVEENSHLIRQVLEEIRVMSHLLHPPLLDEVGLKSALAEYVRGYATRSSIEVTLDLPTQLPRLNQDCELSLFRIVQECLINIHRHSDSPTAAVRIRQTSDEITLEVADQGRGMPPELQAKLLSGYNSGVGLRGMRERVRQLGGTLQIFSNGDGTSIHVALPMAQNVLQAVE